MNTSFLTWPEAQALALSGKLIRREAWPISTIAWMRHRIGGLWELLAEDFSTLGIVTSSGFTSAEFFAEDWTTDPVGTVRDVCERAPRRSRFIPPGIGLTAGLSPDTLSLHADIGDSSPSGCYVIDYFLDGAFVGQLEAPTPGRYTLSLAYDPTDYSSATRIRAWIDVRSRLPLPRWTGHAEWESVFPSGADYDVIDIAADFPDGPSVAPGALYGVQTYGPFAYDAFIYSHSSNPAGADDELILDGVTIFTATPGHYFVAGGATAFLMALPAGQTFTVDVRNSGYYGGYCFALGALRVVRR